MRIDFHCHSFYSKDGFSCPKKLIETAIKKGLDGIALTDHDTIKGWKEADEIAKKLNFLLIFGEEIKTDEGDILGLFLQKEIKSKKAKEAMEEIKSQNGIVIIPHPFHFKENFKGNLEKYLNLIDGIEVFNARLPSKKADKKAIEFAQKYNLAMIAGSDCHYHKAVGDASTLIEAQNLEEIKKAIFERKTKIEGKKSPLFYLIFPTLARISFKRDC
jgi:predicted metal-dependent phosphoesterase TrpH